MKPQNTDSRTGDSQLAGMLASFRHRFDVRVRYGDIDTLGHVNNKSYMSYLEDARIDYYRQVMSFDLRGLRFGTVVRRMEIEYLRPVYLADQVRVYVRCVRIGSKSADFEGVITRVDEKGAESAACRSLATLVSVDQERGVSREWDEAAIRAIEAFEPVPPRRAGGNRGDSSGGAA